MRITVINWTRFNPRSDVKSSSWFRLENTFLSNSDIWKLTNDAKMVWIGVLCEASRKQDETVDINEQLLAALLKVDVAFIDETIKNLQRLGMIDIPTSRGRNAHVTSTSRPRYVHETKRNAHVTSTSRPRAITNGTDDTNETKRHISSISGEDPPLTRHEATPYDSFLSTWNGHCGALPKVTGLSQARRDKIKTRWREKPDMGYWEGCVKKLAASSFARDGKWATFDWLVKNETNGTKAAEGNYDDREANGDGSSFDWSQVGVEN